MDFVGEKCKYTIKGTPATHTVEMTAATLHEAVALGLNQIRGNHWVEGIAGAFNTVTVCVKNVQVEQTVRIGRFAKWLERKRGTPADVSKRRRIKKF